MLRARTDPELPGPEALGLEDWTPLFAETVALDRATPLPDHRDGAERWRFALPGTPGPDGRLTGPPRGAGTGWLELWRWSAPTLRDVVGGRFETGGERCWNLLCHLRAQGVATPMPLCVATSGGLRRASALLVRELEGHRPWVEAWSAAPPADRALFERALGLFLARLARAGVAADDLELADLAASSLDERHDHDHDHAADDDCAAKAIAGLREQRALHSLRKNRLPSVVLARPGGAVPGAWTEPSRRATWRRLVDALGPARSERLELRLARALSGARERDGRRSFVRSLAR